MHEIITVQIGTQSNFLGTHFWNAQESYFTYGSTDESQVNHDVSFRSGIGVDGSDTFTPRALVYDIKESFGTLRQMNALYQSQEEVESIQALGRNQSVIRQPPISQHPYQQYLEDDSTPPELTSANIRFWSDYNRVYYHPRSLVQLQVSSVTASLSPLTSWDSGVSLFDTDDREYDILDRDFRFFAEECDQLQGVMMVAGIDNAWAGFASRYVENLRDELGKGSIWVWGVEEPIPASGITREHRSRRLSNSIRSADSLATNASLYVPLATSPARLPEYLAVDPTSAWETSALQSSVLETISLPTRLRSVTESRTVLSDFEQLFTANAANRKILQADMSKEDAHAHTNGVMTNGASGALHDGRIASHTEEVDESAELFDMSFFPSLGTHAAGLRPHLFDRLIVKRGLSELTQKSSSGREDPYSPTVLQYSSSLGFPTSLSSFPPIFQSRSSSISDVNTSLRASLSANSSVATWLRGMADDARRVLPIHDREDISDALRTWAADYIEGWESASDDADSD